MRERLKELLAETHTTAYKLAKETGIGESTISNFLSGAIKSLTLDKVILIADYFDVTLDHLAGRSDKKEPAIIKNDRPSQTFKRLFAALPPKDQLAALAEILKIASEGR